MKTAILCADYDAAGLKGAYNAADLWSRQGVDVRIVKPPKPGQDFNDLLRMGATE